MTRALFYLRVLRSTAVGFGVIFVICGAWGVNVGVFGAGVIMLAGSSL